MAEKQIPGLGWAKKPVFQVGKGKTLAIPMELHASSRAKLVGLMTERGANGVALFQGGDDINQYDTDTELVFRQDSWFNYLFGSKEPGFYGAIDLSSGKSTLFIPRLPEEYAIVCGSIQPPSSFKEMYGVDDVLYTEDLSSYIASTLPNSPTNSKLHVMHGINSDSGLYAKPASFTGDFAFAEYIETSMLFHALSTARVTKSDSELIAMRYVALIASNAHVEVMKYSEVGMAEYELEAKFMFEIYKKGGCRKAAYTSICACGPNNAVLHYGHAGAPNDRIIENGDMALLDMGADYHGYCSDITCSHPVNGRFTSDQTIIYEGVLNAQRAVYDHMKPGNSWLTCHKLAEREIFAALLKVGVLKNGTVDEIALTDMGGIFMPHGLGHLIGCDTHDVGGYIEGTPERSEQRGTKKLRTARVLEKGMCLTNEPGCYFIDVLLDDAINDSVLGKYMDPEVIDRFRNTGGVRLEDVVVVTETGVENLTTCPRTVEEVESVLNGGQWPPKEDNAKWLHRRWGEMGSGAAAGSIVDITL
jgi:Xaa-Pro dipeptidase